MKFKMISSLFVAVSIMVACTSKPAEETPAHETSQAAEEASAYTAPSPLVEEERPAPQPVKKKAAKISKKKAKK